MMNQYLITALDLCLNEWTQEHYGESANDEAVELVAGLIVEAIQQYESGNLAYYRNLLEKSSTYVQTDMNEETLDEYVEMLEGAMAMAAFFEKVS